MVFVTAVFFYLAVSAFVAAAVAALGHAAADRPAWLMVSRRFLMAGTGLICAQIALRGFQWSLLPFTTINDSLSLFTAMSGAIAIIVTRHPRMQSVLCFYAPALAVMALINTLLGPGFLAEAPRPLSGAFLVVHVGLAIMAYALFFIASMTSVAYVMQVRHLKRRAHGPLMHTLPSLERLDKTLFRLIGVGYPLFVITLVLGVIWAWLDRELLGDMWWISPKIILSVVMVIFYAVSFNGRLVGWLRGRKLAYFVFCGFMTLLITYIVMGVLDLRDYYFWSPSA